MKKYFLNIILLQCVVTFFGLLHHIEGAATCGRCPAGFKWSDCVNCNTHCFYDCKWPCTSGCVCQNDTMRLLGYKCVPKDSCKTTPLEIPICPEGAKFRRQYADCGDFCPGTFKSEKMCDYSQCQWGCKCKKEGHLIDSGKGKCVHNKHCPSV